MNQTYSYQMVGHDGDVHPMESNPSKETHPPVRTLKFGRLIAIHELSAKQNGPPKTQK